MTEVVNGTLRMRGDRILLKPLEWEGREVHGEGTKIAVVRQGRPVRGVVVAIGPGIHPVSKRVKESATRQRIEFSKRFQPTEVKVGQKIELAGLNVFDGAGYQFPEVIVNGEMHLIITERDVAAVHD
jgi:co-chaperonin GroES (HSP10)